MNKQYNVLWLFCEDENPWLSLYGDDTVETPNINALAENGIVCTNCYSVCPVCSPARSGIITGCMPTTIGVHNHVSSRLEEPMIFLPEYLKTIPEIMKSHGYFTFNYGKDDYNFFYNREDLYSGDHEVIKFYGEHGKAISWRDREDKSKPFFGQFTMWGGKNAIAPKVKVDKSKIKVPPYYPDTKVFHELYERHYNQILRTDEEIGHIVDALKKDNEYDNTIIIFMGDHGYQLLRGKQFVYDGGIHIPFIIHLPKDIRNDNKIEFRDDLISSIDITGTTLSLCGIDIPDYMECENILDSNYHRDYIISARDRCDFTIDRIRCVRTKDFKYIRNFYTDRPLMQPQYRDNQPQYRECVELKAKGALNPTQMLMWSDERVPEELYDLHNDPDEINNLADDPKFKDELIKLRGILDTWIEETDDKGQYKESLEEYVSLLKRWGVDRCINPEFDEAKKYLNSFSTYSHVRIEDVL